MTCVCVDVMGSDQPAAVLLEGVEQALKQDPDLSVIVVGDAQFVEPFAQRHERCEACATTEVISMNEHPVQATRTKKDASIVRAAQLVREGKAEGLFSAGSTGAVLTAASFTIGRIKGIKRPALTLVFPSITGSRTVILDVGANADVKDEVIVQFAQMGRVYAQQVLGVAQPRIALLNNGSEEAKGSELTKAFHKALKEAHIPGFVGNAEATDLLSGSFDVVIADGFSGNLALKATEGCAKFIMARLKDGMARSFKYKLGALLLKNLLRAVKNDLSGDEYGGAILLGLKAPVIKGHGATSARAVAQGTLAVAAAVRSEVCSALLQ